MRIRVLGASGSEVPNHNLPAFLIDGVILLDAGTIGLSLSDREQFRIKHILITHSHLDHIKGIPFLLDNMVITNRKYSLTLLSGRDVLDDLRKNVLNDRIWPDFARIPDRKRPALRFRSLSPRRVFNLNGYRVHCARVNHSVPAYGFIIEDRRGKAVAYTGDTGPTELFWQKMAGRDVRCLIVEVSFPNTMSDLAIRSGHLTPRLLSRELEKMPYIPERIYITHVKPQYKGRIHREIGALSCRKISILSDNQVITL